jgi:hypothetical protein
MMKRLAVALVLVVGSAANADSWLPPSKKAYYSADRSVRLTVIPRELESSLAYFEDKVEGREPAGGRAGAAEKTAVARLEQRTTSGWQTVWTKPLVNEVAPVDVVVANSKAFATFDNWHSMGFGPDVIVIYRGDGSKVRQLGLTDLFPDWYVAALPRSISSIHWRREPRISSDGTELTVPVVQPSVDNSAFVDAKVLDLTIRMADGVPIGLERPQWKRALVQAAATAHERCAGERRAVEEWNAPITAPATSKEADWHEYLRETQYRTKWSDDPPAVGTTVLRVPSSPDFQRSVNLLEQALTETAEMEHDLRAIGSPDITRLATEIERIGRRIRRGQLKDVELVVVADFANGDRIRRALAHTGAALQIINPTQSFPQRPERLREETEPTVCSAPAQNSTQAS